MGSKQSNSPGKCPSNNCPHLWYCVNFVHLQPKEMRPTASQIGQASPKSLNRLRAVRISPSPLSNSRPVQVANYLELRQLLHELLLLFAIGEWWQDIQKDFKQVQTLSRHTGQCEDRSDTVDGGMEWTDEEASNRKQRLEFPACNGELLGQERGQRAGVPLSYLLTLSGALEFSLCEPAKECGSRGSPQSPRQNAWHNTPSPGSRAPASLQAG